MIKRYKRIIIGIILGSLGGLLFWFFIGCQSGNCPITSSPVASIIWGAVIGWAAFGSFKKREENRE